MNGLTTADLEGRIELPESIQNHTIVDTPPGAAVYLGEVCKLWFDGLDIRGKAKLRRVDCRLDGDDIDRDDVVQVQRWSLETSSDSSFFLSWGESTIDYDCSAWYRAALLGAAGNEGITLSHELFDRVFGPIDEQLFGFYEQQKALVDPVKNRNLKLA